MLRWAWFLGFALLAPVALPAGGGVRTKLEIRQREKFDPLLAFDKCILQAAPCSTAPALSSLELGAPLRVIRYCRKEDGLTWLHVQVVSDICLGMSVPVSRGWLVV